MFFFTEAVQLGEGVVLRAIRIVRFHPIPWRGPRRDLPRLVALKLDGVGTGLLGLSDECPTELYVTVVVHSRFGDDEARVSLTDRSMSKAHCLHCVLSSSTERRFAAR